MKRDVNRKYFLRVSYLKSTMKIEGSLLGANGVQGDQKLDKTGLGVAFHGTGPRPCVKNLTGSSSLASTNFMN